MWAVFESREARKSLNALPLQILKNYEKWRDVALTSGPLGLKKIRGFKDEALKGKWFGFRSSRLSLQYRIIYKVVFSEIRIEVLRISAHDYKNR